MKLKNVIKALNEVILKLSLDNELQKYLLVDDYDIDATSFVPLSAQEMLDKHYICMTQQTEVGIKDMGRNVFLFITLDNVNMDTYEGNISANLSVRVVMNIEQALVKNYRDRGLLIADRIIDILDDSKLATSGQLIAKRITRVSYSEFYGGYDISFTCSELPQKEVDF